MKYNLYNWLSKGVNWPLKGVAHMDAQNTRKNIYDRICRQCGASFKGGPRAWYCPSCRAIRQREQAARRRRLGPNRHLGDIDQCIICGKDYIIEGGLQKYCPDCAPEQIKAIDKIQGLQYYHTNKDKINSVRKIKRRTMRPCPICGKEYWAVGHKLACCDEHKKQIIKSRTNYKPSSVRGVTWDKYAHAWRVWIGVNKTFYRIGRYKDYKVACEIRKQAEQAKAAGNFIEWYNSIKGI